MAATDVGGVRRENEDAVLEAAPAFFVADGMGGHAGGELASRAAVDALRERLAGRHAATPEQVFDAVQAANEAVRGVSGGTGLGRAGTTLAGVVLVETGGGRTGWLVVNVGDSRVYGWDGRSLEQLTRDHSAVQEYLDLGLIEPEQAATHPDRNVITRALGMADVVDFDDRLERPEDWAAFLVCSDGLTRELDDAAIARFLADAPDGPASAVPALMAAALEDGARDNVSIVVVETGSQPPAVE
ncbi:serine/threonine-protein phosphatase [Agromyces sp. MMS17-SY077]|uniref:Serine/threonine-protein phosphatase n=2 Tax=Agromyces seonyuensis TaxID=2662446 RepID=A0A6I4NT90_9MICO|nr:protein phosphatase 2C domain-containing protein [Agromyces seonyuensis]MWB97676.1 serine/threonine-protein phosphatase [Agromyces seonyuensis]